MNHTCPNCGAPFDVGKVKCDYCGSVYFDMTTIDISDDRTPVYLNMRHGDRSVLVKAYLEHAEFKQTTDTCTLYADNSPCIYMPTQRSKITLEFIGV